MKRSVQVVGEAYRRGRERGVRVSVEAPHVGMTAQDVAEAAQLLELIGEPDLGVTYDASHALAGGFSVQQGFDLIGDRITRVQARDSRNGDIHHTPGEGDYDWDALLRHLDAKGFAGPVVLELEYGGALDRDQIRAAAVQARSFLESRQEALR